MRRDILVALCYMFKHNGKLKVSDISIINVPHISHLNPRIPSAPTEDLSGPSRS